MNIHRVQSVGAEVEARILMRSAVQLVTGQRNAPICGIIQDGLVGGYLLTNTWLEGPTAGSEAKGGEEDVTMITKEVFYRVIGETDIPLGYVDDMLLRAKKHYSKYIKVSKDGQGAGLRKSKVPGKLLASILFPPTFTYSKRTDVNARYPVVKIDKGIILPDSGPLCKKTIGVSPNSIVHVLWKEYTPEDALRFLSDTQMVIYHWLPSYGFTLDVQDCLTSTKSVMAETLASMDTKVNGILSKYMTDRPSASEGGKRPNERSEGGSEGGKRPNDRTNDRTSAAREGAREGGREAVKIDAIDEAEINGILNSAMNIGLRFAKDSMAKGERNAFHIMRSSGAKGSYVNLLQIVAFVGQQNIKGHRIQHTSCKNTRTTPHFLPGDFSAEALGFVRNNYFDGLTPYEAFCHSASGRVGVISTAIGTAESGYIAKKIEKKTEDFVAKFDGTVRDSNGRVIQFAYGGDGMDPKKLYYNPPAKGVKQPFFCNPSSIATRLNTEVELEGEMDPSKDRKIELSEKMVDMLLSNIKFGYPGFETDVTLLATKNAHEDLRKLLVGVQLYPKKIPQFCTAIRDMYETSKIQNGEMVGLLASSSVSEPSTQMTLNTFHYAGVSEKDVSAGIPRLNELLNATQAKSQKKATGVLYLTNDFILKANRKLQSSKKDDDDDKVDTLVRMNRLKSDFCELFTRDFIVSHRIEILPSDEFEYISRVSPVDLLRYNEFEEPWWLMLYCKLADVERPKTTDSFCLRLEIDVKKLYSYRLTVGMLCASLNRVAEEKYICYPSPDTIGEICVFTVDEKMVEYALSKSEDMGMRRGIITDANMEFFIFRDVLRPLVFDTCISGIPGIIRANPRLDTSGTNEWVMDVNLGKCTPKVARERFLNILTADHVDPYRTMIDDMHSIKDVLGIEAVRKFLIAEYTRIISFDGSYVNPRHIDVLVDAMTHTGEITSVSRSGIDRSVGPIAKITFEETVTNGVEAAAFSERDALTGNSACVTMGLPGNFGTGSSKVTSAEHLPFGGRCTAEMAKGKLERGRKSTIVL